MILPTLEEIKLWYEDFPEPLRTQRATEHLKMLQSRANVANIPNWASWTELEAQTWGDTNIGTPLTTARTNLTAMSTINLTTFKSAMTVVLNILDAMWTMLQALTQMTIAMRNDIWPNLQNGGSGAQAQKIK